jgi:hypothetical protein
MGKTGGENVTVSAVGAPARTEPTVPAEVVHILTRLPAPALGCCA